MHTATGLFSDLHCKGPTVQTALRLHPISSGPLARLGPQYSLMSGLAVERRDFDPAASKPGIVTCRLAV